MKKHTPAIWIEGLSLLSLPTILTIAYKNKGAKVRFLKSKTIIYQVMKVLEKIGIIPVKISQVTCSLGDMWIDNQSMAMKCRFDLSAMAHKAFQVIKERHLFRNLYKILPEEKLDLFFEQEIRDEIRPTVNLLQIAHWHKSRRNDAYTNNIILYPDCGLAYALRKVWPDGDISLVSYRSINFKYIKKRIKHLLFGRRLMVGSNCPEMRDRLQRKDFTESNYRIGLHYVEGIDLERRSDIFWYSSSDIAPDRILAYFDLNKSLREPVQENTLKRIERMRMQWVALQRSALGNPAKCIWRDIKNITRIKEDMKTLKVKGRARSDLDSWISNAAKGLISSIERWMVFYKFFNIKIVFDMSMGGELSEKFAQSIAMAFVGGIRVGVQRSILMFTENKPYLRFNTNHIFFTLSKLTNIHKGTSNIIEKFIISGYPFDQVFYRGSLRNNPRDQLKNGDKKFVVALFDEVYGGGDSRTTRNMTVEFYRKFLEWLIEDEEIAIISKEKDPDVFERLTEIHDLVAQAKTTGRYIRLENPRGRLPSDASYGADIAVGIELSTAVAEAVISGCKGVFCDSAKHLFHPFYKWGRDKVVFDDIDRLMTALKRYKDNREAKPKLGDWSSHLEDLDTFRDGKAGERIGSYLRWLLVSLDKGKTRDEAMQYADMLYTEKWGGDKIIDMRSRKEPIHVG